MEVIPAVDLRGGRCVRLYQGDYNKETVYFEDPVEAALHWQALGARRIHVVDLDGAASGRPGNLDAIRAMALRVKVPLQMGGGIRDLETAREVIKLGVERIIFGTSAILSPELVSTVCMELGSKSVIVGIDARDGNVAIKGWKESSSLSVARLVEQVVSLGVARIIYTDISRDGTLTEPNFREIEGLVSRGGIAIIASGGISSLEHIKRLAQIGVEGAIVGKALYAGVIGLEEAIKLAGKDDKGKSKQLT